MAPSSTRLLAERIRPWQSAGVLVTTLATFVWWAFEFRGLLDHYEHRLAVQESVTHELRQQLAAHQVQAHAGHLATERAILERLIAAHTLVYEILGDHMQGERREKWRTRVAESRAAELQLLSRIGDSRP